MSTIVPRPTPAQVRLDADRLSRVDGCPEACGAYAAPERVSDAPEGFRAYYWCEDCRKAWMTNWSDDRVEWML